MAIKKSELYSSLWKSCDALRGGMDTSVYKDYILVLLFIKYVTDKADTPDALIEVPETEWEEKLPDGTVNVIKLRGFDGLRKLKNKKEIGDHINKKIIAPIAKANDLQGIIDIVDFNDEKKLGEKGSNELVDKVSKLIAVFENPALDFSKNRVADDDILGDAYEYLMRNFATESGKSKGQFYTPSEVSQIVAKVLEIPQDRKKAKTTIYDPTCGSGSLLLKVFEETDYKATVYGQEMQFETAGLAKMNMILHKNEIATIARGNTLASPAFRENEYQLTQFDYAVANPPFSYKDWSQGVSILEDSFNRFALGAPPDKNGDYAFLLHILTSLKPNGRAAVILPHGVLFRGNAEATIRENLVQRGYIKGIIGLPANLFYGTGIPACIIILDKENAQARKGIFFVDASKGFMKDGNKNRLRFQDVHKIVDTFTKQLETPRYARMVSLEEIVANEYNLNIPRYIDNQEPEDIQSIEGHLFGGIPAHDVDALAPYWEAFEGLKAQLAYQVREGFYGWVMANFQTQMDNCQQVLEARILERLGRWQEKHTPALYAIGKDTKAKMLMHELSEDILVKFDFLPLIDKYDIFQYLRVYWAEVMQDDVYMVVAEGWKAELAYNEKTKEADCDLLPKALVIEAFFQQEQDAIAQVQARCESLRAEMEAMTEEHGGEDGALYAKNFDKEKINEKSIAKRLKEAEGEETDLLQTYLLLLKQESEAKQTLKKQEQDLEKKVIQQYKILSPDEIRALVIERKWLASLHQRITGEASRLVSRLAQRLKTLEARYSTPLPALKENVQLLNAKVQKHLRDLTFNI